jgi:leucyl-tRNA synthetase
MKPLEFKFKTYDRYWQIFWKKNIEGVLFSKTERSPKFFPLDMFPYPSGSGLHIGHPLGYLATDVISRYKTDCLHSVIHNMGWDAFGLPSEQDSLLKKKHPALNTKFNIINFKKQLEFLGLTFNWCNEVNTTNKNYYKYTQLFFLVFFKKKIASIKKTKAVWCEGLKTILSNEEVVNGLSERGKYPVTIKYLNQWSLNMKRYAIPLINGLKILKWPQRTKNMQFNWIGFYNNLYLYSSLSKNIFLRQFSTSIVNYLFSTVFIIYPLLFCKYKTLFKWNLTNKYTKKKIFIKVLQKECSNVLFKKTSSKKVFLLELVNSFQLDGLHCKFNEARTLKWWDFFIKPVRKINLKRWVFSRQRIWGEPFPIVWVNNVNFQVFRLKTYLTRNPFQNILPVKKVYKIDSGERYVAVPANWNKLPFLIYGLNSWGFNISTTRGMLFKCFLAKTQVLFKFGVLINCKFDLNVMPQWAGSCWYYLNYIDDRLKKSLLRDWKRPNFYIGGSEHAVLHLLYSRFWNYTLYESKIIFFKEPFLKLAHQGLLLLKTVYVNQLSCGNIKLKSSSKLKGRGFFTQNLKIILYKKADKMSKSSPGNTNPLDVISLFGADSIRFYELYMGEFEMVKAWSLNYIRFIYKLIANLYCYKFSRKVDDSSLKCGVNELVTKTHSFIKTLRFYKFNMLVKDYVVKLFFKEGGFSISTLRVLKMFSYTAPHISEELFLRLGFSRNIASYIIYSNLKLPRHDSSKKYFKWVFMLTYKIIKINVIKRGLNFKANFKELFLWFLTRAGKHYKYVI